MHKNKKDLRIVAVVFSYPQSKGRKRKGRKTRKDPERKKILPPLGYGSIKSIT